MFERFDKRSQTVVVDARSEAVDHADALLGAEHLLLALARRSGWDAGLVLAGAGLNHQRLRSAIDADIERTLETVGVSASTIRIPSSSLRPVKEPRWGTSAKRALERAARAARDHGDRRILPTHILIGVLGAAEGTVPRALTAAGVDVDQLVAAAEAELGAAG
ncbi:MAG: Clp protease N-terminal domain-containing protein [Actinomycetota bacterium]